MTDTPTEPTAPAAPAPAAPPTAAPPHTGEPDRPAPAPSAATPPPASPAPASPAPASTPAPRATAHHPAALIVAATLSFVAAAATIGGLFPDFWDSGTFALIDLTGPLAQQLVFAASFFAIGVALLSRRTSTAGAAAAAVVVVVGLQPRVVDIVTLADDRGPRGGAGFSLTVGGFVLALAAAALAAAIELRPRAWSLRGSARAWATFAALFGFATAVGYAMEPFRASVSSRSPFFFAYGSPFEAIGGPRSLWAAVLVVVVLTVVPPTSVAVGRAIGVGLAFGLLGALGGIAALRLGETFGTSGTEFTGVGGAEGTWTFLAAAGATLLVVLGGLAAGRRRTPRRRNRPPGAAPDAPTEPAPVLATPDGAPDPGADARADAGASEPRT
jgi:hypothetical protein